MIDKRGMPLFSDTLNETTGDNRLAIAFDNINGHMEIFLTHQETDGYGTLKAAATTEAEIKFAFAHKDGGKTWRYNSNDYENDIKGLLSSVEELSDSFDKKLKELLTKRQFT